MIYLIDASVYVFRAYYSVPDRMTDVDGNPTNAVYGFGRFLIDLLRTTQADHVAVAFDESLSTSFRNELYPPYKANREPAPDELKRQFGYCRQLATALGLHTVADERFEADDLIGTLVACCQRASKPAAIVTRDKDLAQLVGPDDIFWDYAGGQKFAFEQIEERFGARPERIADFLALTGDSVDNIKGVPGIGKKTASAIFGAYATLDDVYANLDNLKDLSVRGAGTLAKKLDQHREAAYLAQALTTIRRDVPMEATLAALKRAAADHDALNELFDTLSFGGALRKQALAV